MKRRSRTAACCCSTSCRSSSVRALEALRQPLEDGVVAIARAAGAAIFPARFQLVATMNLCACGARGDPAAECSCSPQRLAAFRDKLSRALLDRFDLVVTVPRPRAVELAAQNGEASEPVRARVVAARSRAPAPRTAEADELLSRAVDRLPLSARGRARVARVARTIAALAGADAVAARARRRGAGVPIAAGARSVTTTFASSNARVFPPLLRAIYDPPRRLYVRGGADDDVLARPAVAVVGARACSPYGAQVARRLGRELAAAGLVVVSGLARGIDGEAHRGALEAGGVTVAVLGCGIDRDYPAAHAELARRIRERGLVVSEYEPGVEPAPWRFPARNRIIAGLCAATVVVEARERSGALITADLALEEGRDVLAVPGEITSSLSAGRTRC